jgi:hypothetical protein
MRHPHGASRAPRPPRWYGQGPSAGLQFAGGSISFDRGKKAPLCSLGILGTVAFPGAWPATFAQALSGSGGAASPILIVAPPAPLLQYDRAATPEHRI